jgi:hypothetical protein
MEYSYPMTPWFIATQPFTPEDGDRWRDYTNWSGLMQLRELVSLDGIRCPTLLPEIQPDYWPHIVQEDFMLHYCLDFDFLMSQVAAIERKNILCVYRNPVERPQELREAAVGEHSLAETNIPLLGRFEWKRV